MSSQPHPAPDVDPARPVRTLVLALAGAVPAVTVAVALVVPIEDTSPDPLTVGASVAVVLLTAALARLVGFRTSALPASLQHADATERRAVALGRFQTSTMLRFVVTELGFMLVLAFTLLADDGPWPLLVVALPTALLILLNCWPSRANVDRVATALEADGVRSDLREAFGHA